MANEEYKEFLKFVFNEYTRARIDRISRYWDDPRMWHQWHYEWKRLRRAIDIMNYINNHCDDTDEIYRTFRLKRLRRVIDEIEDGVRWNNRLAEKLGFLDAFDAYYDEIVEGLDISLFPESELDMLRQVGFRDPKSDLQGIIYLLKARKKKRLRLNKEISMSRQLKKTVEVLSESQKEFKEDENLNEQKKPKKSRRWFKGLGQIGQGAALSISNIALATGVLKFPVPPDTQTYGALVSATTGVGMILTGVGDLRGE